MSEENAVVVEAPAASEIAQNPVESAPTEPVAEEVKATEDQPTEVSDSSVEPEKKPGKNSFDRKIDRLYKSAAEQKARADYLEQQLQELKPKNVEPQGAPRIEDFDDIETYGKALGKFEAEQLIKGHQRTQQQEMSRREQANLISDWETKASRAYDKYDDFDEVVGDLKPVNGLTVAIMQAENAEDVAYFLGKNPKEATRIAGLNQIAQIREIGRLELKLANEPLADKTPSKAPAPIMPLSGKSGAISETPSDNDDTATWILKERARMKKAGA